MTADELRAINSPLVTVYLNQRLVFDLMAMLNGGLAMSSTVNSVVGEDASHSLTTDAKLGFGGVFANLFKLDLSASGAHQVGETQRVERGEERTYTPSSIFYALRKTLSEKKLIVHQAAVKYKPGDIVEFSGRLVRNPLVETLGRVGQMLDLMLKVGDLGDAKHRGNQRKEYEGLKRMLNEFEVLVGAGGTFDLLAEKTSLGPKAVVTIEQKFLNDPQMADLVDGEFNVLGKITSAIEGTDGAIDLLRKSAISSMPTEAISALFESFDALSTNYSFNTPTNFRSVQGPAIHVLPLAIYV